MKILRIKVDGLPLFKDELDLKFYATQRVNDEDKDNLYNLYNDFYLNPACTFIGINASGKTSVLKVINLCIHLLNNEPINHVECSEVLRGCENAAFKIYFIDSSNNVCLLETVLTSHKNINNCYTYSILSETFYEKNIASVKSKKYLTDFDNVKPASTRDTNELYLPDDISFIIAHNRKNNQKIDIYSLLSYTNMNTLPPIDNIPLEIISFLDPTIDKLSIKRNNNKTIINLKFKDKDEIILNDIADIELYLSSGTIKGIVTFSVVKYVLESGGYLLMDEIENHFNKEIVASLLNLFMDKNINKKGAVIFFTTHYSELLDIYDRNDYIFITRNTKGITVTNLSDILKRNDIKKSDAYQSGLLGDTTPNYEAYMRLKKKITS